MLPLADKTFFELFRAERRICSREERVGELRKDSALAGGGGVQDGKAGREGRCMREEWKRKQEGKGKDERAKRVK